MKQLLVEWTSGNPAEQQLAEVLQTYEEGRWQNLLFHVYSGVTDRAEIQLVTRSLRQLFPSAHIVGSLSAGEIKDGHLMPAGILISAMLFEQSDIRVWRLDDVQGRESDVGMQIHDILADIPHLKGAELLLPGTQFITRLILQEIQECRASVQIFGGYAGAQDLDCPDHFVFLDSEILSNSVLVITYAGENLFIDADKSIGWQRLGLPYEVTKADETRLIELSGQPAVELYEKLLQLDRKSFDVAEDVFQFPLMVQMNGQDLLRATAAVEEDGSLVLCGYITEGTEVYLSYGNPSEIVAKVDLRLEKLRHFHPEAILLYSCLVRRIFWEDFVDMEMIPFASLAPTAGFHTLGEVCGDSRTGSPLEYNITMVSIAMREGPVPEEALPPVRVDDSVLKGQSALVQRLTRMVYATTEGLQIAYKDLRALNARLVDMAEHDSLTGLYNRGKTEQLINDALEHAAHTGQSMALLMLDVDYFKQVNDTCGHEAGDIVLTEIASLLAAAADRRTGAQAGRWGGEEFFILLPDATEAEAMAFAQRLRSDVESHDFSVVHHVTISIGVLATWGQEDRKRIYTAVDDALYQAKDAGRNCVILAQTGEK